MCFVICEKVGGDFEFFELILKIGGGEGFAVDDERTFSAAVIGVVEILKKFEVEFEGGGFDEGSGDGTRGNKTEEGVERELGFKVKKDVID